MGDIIRMIVVLTSICGISGFALSYLKITTAPRIEEQVMTYIQGPAILKVFNDIDNSPIAERATFTLPDGRSITVFPGRKDGKLIGVAIEDFGKGYGGDIGIMAGFDINHDTLVGVGVTTMKETPGLGTLIGEPSFTDQFIGKAGSVTLASQGGEIDAISGASISSAGTVAAIQKAAKTYAQLKSDILKTWQ